MSSFFLCSPYTRVYPLQYHMMYLHDYMFVSTSISITVYVGRVVI